jgi:putative endonuclease
MKTTETGKRAEIAARVYLEMRGYEIIEQNWRRPSCEIDIIARKDNTAYFVEVKYRFSDDQGGGLEAITKSKLKQMNFAASSWVQENKWSSDFCLAAVEVAGPGYSIMGFIDSVF